MVDDRDAETRLGREAEGVAGHRCAPWRARPVEFAVRGEKGHPPQIWRSAGIVQRTSEAVGFVWDAVFRQKPPQGVDGIEAPAHFIVQKDEGERRNAVD